MFFFSLKIDFPAVVVGNTSIPNTTAPLVYVAHIPNGKFARQTLEQISEADTEVYAWMQEVRLLGHLVFLGQWIDCQKPETPIILQPQIFR